MQEWHYIRAGQQVGPVSAAEIRNLILRGQVSHGDMVWRDGMANWQPAGEVVDLRSAFAEASRTPQMPPPPPQFATSTNATVEASRSVNVPAGHGARIAASILDSLIGFVLGGIVGLIWGLAGADPESGWITALALLAGATYIIGTQCSGAMATLGKRAVGLIVVSRDGDQLTFGSSLGRYLVLLLTSLLSFPLLVALFNRRHRGLHDMAAGTIVIKKSTYRRDLFNYDQIEAGPSSGATTAIVVLALAVPILGILAAIAIPAYQDYIVRAKVSGAIAQASVHKPAISGYFAANNFQQISAYSDIGVEGSYTTADGNAEIDFNNDGLIVVRMLSEPVTGKTIYLTPMRSGDGIDWSCGSDDVPQKYLPAVCRK